MGFPPDRCDLARFGLSPVTSRARRRFSGTTRVGRKSAVACLQRHFLTSSGSGHSSCVVN